MNGNKEYLEIARSYSDGVRVLLAPSGVEAGERGGRGPASPTELANQAEKLLPLAKKLTETAELQLKNTDPTVRAQASTHLLAKALTDMEVSAYSLRAAQDEEDKEPWIEADQAERGRSSLVSVEEYLRILEGRVEKKEEGTDRGSVKIKDLKNAREILAYDIDDVLDLISSGASKTGYSALQMLKGDGLGGLVSGAGDIFKDITNQLGQVENISHLYNLFRSFIVSVWESLLALLGLNLVKQAAGKVIDWVKELGERKIFEELIKKLYLIKQTNDKLQELVEKCQVDIDKFNLTIQELDMITHGHKRQLKLAEKLLTGLKYLGNVSAAILPQGKLILGAFYIILGGYVILTGADYVDAPKLDFLDRIPGVRQVVENHLMNI